MEDAVSSQYHLLCSMMCLMLDNLIMALWTIDSDALGRNIRYLHLMQFTIYLKHEIVKWRFYFHSVDIISYAIFHEFTKKSQFSLHNFDKLINEFFPLLFKIYLMPSKTSVGNRFQILGYPGTKWKAIDFCSCTASEKLLLWC